MISNKNNKERISQIIKMLICVVLLVVAGWIIYGTTNLASVQRELKSIKSEYDNGLNRTVTVYDYNGKEIKSWTGKFDVTESENEVYFDTEDDKRVIIHGGIVINEEQ